MKIVLYCPEGFKKMQNKQITFEQVRDHLRNIMHQKDPAMFPTGPNGTSVTDLAKEMLKVTQSVSSSQHQCSKCDYAEESIDNRLTYVLHADNTVKCSTNHWINHLSQSTNNRCPECNHKMKQVIFYNDIPHIIILEYPLRNIQTSHSLQLVTDDGEIKELTLKGIVYHRSFHFTSRIISDDEQVWYHDGITTGKVCIQDGKLGNITESKMKQCRCRKLVLSIYAQKHVI